MHKDENTWWYKTIADKADERDLFHLITVNIEELSSDPAENLHRPILFMSEKHWVIGFDLGIKQNVIRRGYNFFLSKNIEKSKRHY